MGAPRPPRSPAFALTVPGIGPILHSQALTLGLRPTAVESDGRADVVPLGLADRTALSRLRTAEDLFVEVALLRHRRTGHSTAAGLDPGAVAVALDHLRRLGGRVDRRSFRVVTRVLEERRYNRTTLRDAVIRRLQGILPTWRPAPDAGAVELWVLQVTMTDYRVGLRLGGLGRRVTARAVERRGALRPAVAAAMVHLAGPPQRGVLLDPCCGTGTILSEAEAAGWLPAGGDIDVAAARSAVANGCARVAVLDARRLPFPDDVANVVVTNLPFGRQHRVQGLPVAWYRRVLAEASRVAPLAIVLAAASTPYRQALGRLPLELRARRDIVLLGDAACIWTLERREV